MTGTLFDLADVYDGDPLQPDTETVTPAEIVAELTPEQREIRLDWLISQAFSIYGSAIGALLNGRRIAARCLLFSGGNDSTTLAHLFRTTATHAIHANTGIGVEETRQFVRDTCAAWGLPLIEKHGEDYEELVVERGFPGPAMHWLMYSRLKERAIDAARRDLGVARSRTKCVILIAGRRREESKRREDVPLYESDGSAIWVSPFAMWTKLDLNTYRARFDVPRNRVADLIHMSGECLCGAFAKPGELDEIRFWFPEVGEQIDALTAEVRAAGHAAEICQWGHGKGQTTSRKGRLCTSCVAPDAQILEIPA